MSAAKRKGVIHGQVVRTLALASRGSGGGMLKSHKQHGEALGGEMATLTVPLADCGHHSPENCAGCC